LKLIYGGQPTGKLASWELEWPNLKRVGKEAESAPHITIKRFQGAIKLFELETRSIR
jgi:hypothetical protein